jgi:glycosyltransferase involved in cell wall biosynthesis
MRIVHITPSYHPEVGGAETYTRALSERLVERGHDVTVVTLAQNSPNTPTSTRDIVNGVRVRRLRPVGRLHGLAARAATIEFARWAHRWAIPDEAVDMWAQSSHGLRPVSAALRAGADVITVINWYGAWLPYQLALARRLQRFALIGVPLFHTECEWANLPVFHGIGRRFDAIVGLTEHERRFIEECTGITRTCAVGAGIDPEAFAKRDGAAVRARLGIGNAPVVGYVGRMVASKGVSTLLTAMKRIWQIRPDVRLLLAGDVSNQRNEVSRAVAALSSSDRARVICVGAFDAGQKASLFDSLDVFAMPSVAESFGIAYLEAWMCRKPVIGSRIGATRCVIEDGIDGVLITPGSVEELSNAILGLLSDPTTCQQMGMRGYTKTVANFTWQRVAETVERIYADALVTSADR